MTETITPRKRKRKSKSASQNERLPFLARLRIDSDIPSLNELLRSTYKRRMTSGKLKDQWRERLYDLQLEQLGIAWIRKIEVSGKHPRRRLEIIRRCRRLKEKASLYGGAKPVVEALKAENQTAFGKSVGKSPGWFYDDSETYLDLHIIQLPIGEDPWVELVLFGHMDEKK